MRQHALIFAAVSLLAFPQLLLLQCAPFFLPSCNPTSCAAINSKEAKPRGSGKLDVEAEQAQAAVSEIMSTDLWNGIDSGREQQGQAES